MLTQAALDELQDQDPLLAACLYRNIASHLSARLRLASALRTSSHSHDADRPAPTRA